MSSLAVAKPSEEQLVKKATQQQCKFEHKADADAFKDPSRGQRLQTEYKELSAKLEQLEAEYFARVIAGP